MTYLNLHARKILLFLATCCLLLMAQQQVMAQIHVGAYAGLNNEKFVGPKLDSARFNWGSGFAAGVTFDFRIAKDVWLSIEPGFASSNGKIAILDSGIVDGKPEKVFKDSIDLKYNYINIPLLVRVKSDNGRWDYVGGVEGVFPMKLTTTLDGVETNWDNILNNSGLSASFGLAYHFPLKWSRLGIELRYSQGLFDITQNIDDSSNPGGVRMRTIKLFVTWKLPHKDE